MPSTSGFGPNVAKPHNAPLPCANPTTPHHTHKPAPHHKERKIPPFLVMVRADANVPLERRGPAVSAASRMMQMFPMGQTILEDG